METIIWILKNEGFVIVSDSVFDEVKTELLKRGISTECLYRESEKKFTDVVDMTGQDNTKRFFTDPKEKNPKLYRRNI